MVNRPWTRFAGVALLFAAAFITYWPAIHGSFIWDDGINIDRNPLVRSDRGLIGIWTAAPEAYDFYPLTWTAWWLQWRAFGRETTGYHVVNLILHAGDVCTAAVLGELAQYAPVTAVVGNNDGSDVAAWGAAETASLTPEGLRIAMIHDSGPAAGRLPRMRARFPGADLVVFGHSHIPLDTADEIFLASTTRDVQGLHRYNDRELEAPGPVTRRCLEIWRQREAQDSDPM